MHLRQAAIITVFVAFLASFHLAGQSAPPPAQLPGWTLTWHDEFDGPGIDSSKWEVLTRRDSYNQEKQFYLPAQAAVADGLLRITSVLEPYEGKLYRSARLEGRYEQSYGRFEIRAQIPTTQGIWPALWLLPRSARWPLGGEIDIMEHKGSEPHTVSSAYHFADKTGKHRYVTARYQAIDENGQAIRWPDGFHVYAAEWDSNQIRFYVDGVEHFRATSAEVPISSTPMHVVLNTAVGGNFDGDPDASTIFPQVHLIDYVRVYKRD
jgi:beta-glucanase (GH16 family)